MAEQRQKVTERMGGVSLSRAWLRDLDLTSPEGSSGGCPRTGVAGSRLRSWGFGRVESRPGARCCPIPWNPLPTSLCSSVTCLIALTGLNASSLHLCSVSRFLSDVTHSFLSLSICPFTQSVHGEPIFGPVLQGIPQGAHSQLVIWLTIQRSTGGREIRAGVGDAQTLGIRRKFPEKVMQGFES